MTRHSRHGAVVIGIGNIIRSDDGLGIHVLQALREHRQLGPEVQLIDGGTAGLLLLPYLADARHAIVVDAVRTGAPAGTLIRRPDAQGLFGTGLTPHDVGLADLLDAARLADAWPETLILHGAQPDSTEIGIDLTPPLAASVESLVSAVEADLFAWGYAATAIAMHPPADAR